MISRYDPDDVTREASSSKDDVADLLAAYDEQLRNGTNPNLHDATTVQFVPGPKVDSLIGCLHLLERAWPRSPVEEDLSIPKQIGRFQLESVLGVGGFGVVYKAYDPTLRRQVALKVPRLHSLADDDLAKRFEREARAAAALDHPNIVPVLETGQAGPIRYIASAYCSGPNLAEWLKEQTQPVPVDFAASLIRKLAEAVHYSHLQHVLHRDLKPGNVMLVPFGQSESPGMTKEELPFVPRLTDFGIAKVLDDDGSILKTDTFAMGTPAYMSPEQTGKRDCPIGPAADVYGLGVMFYELLTGRTPFQGTNAADVMDQIQNSEPVSPRQLRREIPSDLETICLKCLEKKPSSRFLSAQDLADELRRFQQGQPILSRPVSPIEYGLRWCRRKPSTAGLIGVSTISLIAILGFVMTHTQNLARFNKDIKRANSDLTEALVRTKEMKQIAENSESQTRDALYASDINRAAVAWKDEDTMAMTALLDRHVPKPGERDRRGFEWWYLHGQAVREHRVLLDVGTALYALCPSPDRKIWATAGLDATVRLFDPETGAVLQEIVTGQIEVNGLAFSPDGKELATSGDDCTIRVWDLKTNCERIAFKAHPGKAYQLFFTPDGSEIVSSGDNPIIRVFDAQSGQLRRELGDHHGNVASLTLGNDGRTFASTYTATDAAAHPEFTGTAVLWDLKSWNWKREPWFGIGSRHGFGPVAFREDLDLMVVAADASELVSIRISQNKTVAIAKDLENVESLAWHPNGSLLATGNKGGRIRFWNVGPHGELTTSDIPAWQAHRGLVYSVVWTDDGSRLISAGDDGRVLSWSRTKIESPNPRRIQIPHFNRFCLIPKTDQLLISQPIGSPNTTGVNWPHENRAVIFQDHGFDEISPSRDGQFVAGLKELEDHSELDLLKIQKPKDAALGLTRVAKWAAPGKLRCVRVSPDSRSVAVSHWFQSSPEMPPEHFVCLLAIPDLERKTRIPVPHSKGLAFSPDGTTLALATQTGLALWDLEHDRVVWDVPLRDVTVLTFSPDGRFIVTGGDDRLVVFHNATDGTVHHRLAGHRGRVRYLAFSPDNRTLASGDNTGVIKLWSVDAAQELLEFANSDADDLEFSADGRQLFFKVTPSDVDHSEILIYDTPDDRQ